MTIAITFQELVLGKLENVEDSAGIAGDREKSKL